MKIYRYIDQYPYILNLVNTSQFIAKRCFGAQSHLRLIKFMNLEYYIFETSNFDRSLNLYYNIKESN